MAQVLDHLFRLSPALAYGLVGLLVFAEDALFFGFVVPGETAAVVGGVLAHQGRVQLWLMVVIVIAAAIAGDSVGYEVGRRVGPRLLRVRLLARVQGRLAAINGLIRRRGGAAVFLGRFVAFTRALMPALAGISEMRYRTFVTWNAAGGLVWGAAFVTLGFLAGHSYEAVASTAGGDAAAVLAVLVVAALIVWRVGEALRRRRAAGDDGSSGR
jgi:membrane protein DedA with SNARE-associated domain